MVRTGDLSATYCARQIQFLNQLGFDRDVGVAILLFAFAILVGQSPRMLLSLALAAVLRICVCRNTPIDAIFRLHSNGAGH